MESMEEKHVFRNLLPGPFPLRREHMHEFFAYFSLLLALPLMLGHLQGLPNQLLIGSAVNMLLFISAFRMSGWKSLLLIISPSAGAYLSGLVLGASTAFLLYFIPAIWLGNFVYVYGVKKFAVLGGRLAYAAILSSFAKACLLFVVALALVSLDVVPGLFLVAMGPLQLATALSGAALGSLSLLGLERACVRVRQ
jgi:hypothetical protein